MFYISNMCILCLTKNYLVKLDEAMWKDYSLLFPEIHVSNSEMSLHICSSCEVGLEAFYIFRKKSLESYNIWQSYVKNLQSSTNIRKFGDIHIKINKSRKRKITINTNLQTNESEPVYKQMKVSRTYERRNKRQELNTEAYNSQFVISEQTSSNRYKNEVNNISKQNCESIDASLNTSTEQCSLELDFYNVECKTEEEIKIEELATDDAIKYSDNLDIKDMNQLSEENFEIKIELNENIANHEISEVCNRNDHLSKPVETSSEYILTSASESIQVKKKLVNSENSVSPNDTAKIQNSSPLNTTKPQVENQIEKLLKTKSGITDTSKIQNKISVTSMKPLEPIIKHRVVSLTQITSKVVADDSSEIRKLSSFTSTKLRAQHQMPQSTPKVETSTTPKDKTSQSLSSTKPCVENQPLNKYLQTNTCEKSTTRNNLSLTAPQLQEDNQVTSSLQTSEKTCKILYSLSLIPNKSSQSQIENEVAQTTSDPRNLVHKIENSWSMATITPIQKNSKIRVLPDVQNSFSLIPIPQVENQKISSTTASEIRESQIKNQVVSSLQTTSEVIPKIKNIFSLNTTQLVQPQKENKVFSSLQKALVSTAKNSSSTITLKPTELQLEKQMVPALQTTSEVIPKIKNIFSLNTTQLVQTQKDNKMVSSPQKALHGTVKNSWSTNTSKSSQPQVENQEVKHKGGWTSIKMKPIKSQLISEIPTTSGRHNTSIQNSLYQITPNQPYYQVVNSSQGVSEITSPATQIQNNRSLIKTTPFQSQSETDGKTKIENYRPLVSPTSQIESQEVSLPQTIPETVTVDTPTSKNSTTVINFIDEPQVFVLFKDKQLEVENQKVLTNMTAEPKVNSQNSMFIVQNPPSEVNIKCKFCGISCNNIKEFKCHFQTHLQQTDNELRKHIKKIKCPICSCIFSCKYLKEHMLLHNKHNLDLDTSDSYLYRKEKEESTADTEKMKQFLLDNCLLHNTYGFTCKICQTKLPGDRLVINSHTETHLQNCIFGCPICNKPMNQNILKIHMEVKHMDNKSVERYICLRCQKIFTNIPDFLFHIDLHFSRVEFGCSLCNFTDIDKHTVNSHIITHFSLPVLLNRKNLSNGFVNGAVPTEYTTDTKKYICILCEQKYGNENHLKIHYEMHEMFKDLKCLKCKMQFIDLDIFHIHMQSHENQFSNIVVETKDSDNNKIFIINKNKKSDEPGVFQKPRVISKIKTYSKYKSVKRINTERDISVQNVSHNNIISIQKAVTHTNPVNKDYLSILKSL